MRKSLLNKNWELRELSDELDLIRNILKNRGIEGADDINTYLNCNIKKGFHNPFLMKDMEKAVSRINKAIDLSERIVVFGDYDVDGISGTAILVNTLKKMNANASYRLPHRVNDGYGLSEKFIEEFKNLGVKVLITVDCGISCSKQIELASEYGIDVIITDHHTIPESIPTKSYAILHPKQEDCQYPFKGLTGSGVAFKLASALIKDRLPSNEREDFLYYLFDLASLGTVADIGPLLGENRIIVKHGLEAMRETRWPGLAFLMDSAGIDRSQKLDVSVIGFKIGPRINAAGRIDHPYHALRMLLHEGEDREKARELANKLEVLNQERQQMVFDAIEQAFNMVENTASDKKILIVASPEWHVGILGLIAGKLLERYNLPTIALQEMDGNLVASFRSNKYFNAVEALNRVAHLLDHYGGHFQAAGFNIKKENLEPFIEEMNSFANEKLKGIELKSDLLLDADLTEVEINEQFIKLLSQMEPFGYGNEKPLFLIRNAIVSDIRRVGKEKQHLHFHAGTEGNKYPCISFKMGEYEEVLRSYSSFDLALYLEKNIWNGREALQFQVIDLRPSIKEVSRKSQNQ